MKEERERQKALLREQRRLQRVWIAWKSNKQMKEDAIERGEEVSDSEESEETDDPGFLPNGSVAAVPTHVLVITEI